jgi:pilus assembly protein CpaE
MYGRIVTVLAAKGGAGATTVALNLAVVLGARRLRVCVIDLDTAFGDIAKALDLAPTATIASAPGLDLLGDRIAVLELVTTHSTGLHAVLAPARPGQAGLITPDLVARLLMALSDQYDVVVVDTAGGLSANVLTALDMAHHQVVVSTPEVPALHNLRSLLDTMDLLAQPRDLRSVILNRSDAAAISAALVEEIVGYPIAAHVPASRDVTAAINRGKPLAATDPEHVLTLALTSFADRQLSFEVAAPTAVAYCTRRATG